FRYEESVKKMRPIVLRWKNVTDEMLQELRRAKKELKSQGARSDLVANDTKLRTWGNYLKDIGLDRVTVHRWLATRHRYNTLRWASTTLKRQGMCWERSILIRHPLMQQ